MISLRCLLALPASLLLCVCLPQAFASPTVDVSLQASFQPPPLLVQLLESAAAEDKYVLLPLLDRIAEGGLDGTSSDEELYLRFRNILKNERLFRDPTALSSWDMAVSLGEAAPRIEAQYQFWNSSVRYLEKQFTIDEMLPIISIWRPNRLYCHDARCNAEAPVKSISARFHTLPRAFDRIIGSPVEAESWVIYVDPSESAAMESFKVWRSTFPDASFRLRYRLPLRDLYDQQPVSGYGVELTLKRTDYIVIDDREAGVEASAAGNRTDIPELSGDTHSKTVKPLSSSELLDLGIKTSSFVMESEDPTDILAKLARDFPKHASSLSAQSISPEFMAEHLANRDLFLPPGHNRMWINGVQLSARDINAFSLLDHLRRERGLINGLKRLGLTATNAIKLLSHDLVAESRSAGDVHRYDFKDDMNGGHVIIWLNNIEKDKRYAEWPKDLSALLQRTFPGQLPAVRRDIHNVIFPLDLSKPKAAKFLETLRNLVQRMVPIRIGLVPTVGDHSAIDQAKVVHYLHEAYGLAAVLEYVTLSLQAGAIATPTASVFDTVTNTRNIRRDQNHVSLSEVLSPRMLSERIENTKDYLRRLGADGQDPPLFVNGAPITNDEDWMQVLGQRVTLDVRKIQELVFEEKIDREMWVPDVFLHDASAVRNAVIIPEDESAVKLFDMETMTLEHGLEMSGYKLLTKADGDQPALTVFLDLMSDRGYELLVSAVDFAQQRDNVNLMLCHFSDNRSPQWTERASKYLKEKRPELTDEVFKHVEQALLKNVVGHGQKQSAAFSPLAEALGLRPGEQGILISGRLVGPLPSDRPFSVQDFDMLISYEQKKRISPALEALKDLGSGHLIKSHVDLSKLTSIVALSAVSDVPEGMFDADPGPRMAIFNNWTAEHTCITLGEQNDPAIDVVVSLDPVSEVAQRWIPIIQVLSKLDHVRARIFLNPSQKLQELPVKRFYRQVLESKLSFSPEGKMLKPKAQFDGIPEDTLLTLAMDTPQSWLVAPYESIHDLDNIKLSSLKGSDSIRALYNLENILIEGHSRDMTSGSPPRGVQLSLATETMTDFAGTIIMANLGYFQFKANPGVYELALRDKRSKQVFNIDSAGAQGYAPQAGDETTEIALFSYQGSTIFPRLSRRPGQERADVLEMPELPVARATSAASKGVQAVFAKGASAADHFAERVGLPDMKPSELLRKGAALGQGIFSKLTSGSDTAAIVDLVMRPSKHAEINIFSVASGHLYERMLNIMMVSVMRHTKHTVKFWFIEQFLSPSFKTFLPTLAAEYEFDYEMVTYHWPHWLRAQKEKQRVIWGYKILFLDVLFPLDLDKVIFVDADQIVRTDMYDLVTHDLEGAPYGFTPMCDSRTEMEGFRFWKQGYWKTFLRGLPYHISALYVVDLKLFRAMAAGDRLRQQYHSLSADPNSLSNLDQDLPNHMQMSLPIHSLPQEWLWCETWCDDESLKVARTIDLCNNPMTKEPKLDRARRQVPEWTEYDDEIAALARSEREKTGELAGLAVEAAEEPGAAYQRPMKDEL